MLVLWTEAIVPEGWRCRVFHPPLRLPANAVRRAPFSGDRRYHAKLGNDATRIATR